MNANPPATPITKVPVAKISIDQAEGITGCMLNITVFSWADAARALRQIKSSAPTKVYYKTDVVVTWANGQTVAIREDVMNNNEYKADLSASIRQRWQFYAGFYQPAHYTDEDYTNKILSDTKRRDEATMMLKHYSLEDPPAPATPKPVTVDRKADIAAATKPMARMADWPAQAEIGHIATLVTGLVKRAEDPLMKGIQNAETIRTLSMELRKALAALQRAEDVA
jgi:hypothetical protein